MNSGRILWNRAISAGDDDDIVADPNGTPPVDWVEPQKGRVSGSGRFAFEFWYDWLDDDDLPVFDATKTLTLRPVIAVSVGETQYLDAGESETVAFRNPIQVDELLNGDRLYILFSDMNDPPATATKIRLYGRELKL